MTSSKSFNNHPKHMALYHALMESILADEDAMDQGPVYNLLKGTCKSCVELEYNMKECYKALNDQLDWNNSEGDRCPFDLSKPLPLVKSQGDFPRLHLNDIEDMLLLVVQNKLFNLKGDVIVDLAVALTMFTRRIVIQKGVDVLQLGI
ncbi:hypothetical protein Tco_0613283 [Tanacetum coccineum]